MNLKHKYNCQKSSAALRNIPFQLTFDEWLAIWTASGHLHERGRNKNQFNMSRFNDIGPYAVGNVFIQRHEDNLTQAHTGSKRPPRDSDWAKNQELAHGRKVSVDYVTYDSIIGASRSTGLARDTISRRIHSQIPGYCYL